MLIQANVSYEICAHGGRSNQNLNNILVGQKRAIREVLNLKSNQSVKQHLSDL